MYYLRRNKKDKPIYLCPHCGADIYPSGELVEYLMRAWHAKGGKTTASKLTPEERKAKAIKAINARWHKWDGAQISPVTEQSTVDPQSSSPQS